MAAKTPIRRRLDLKTDTAGGGGREFVKALLVDDGDQEHFVAHGTCALPDRDAPLGDTGLTIEEFLDRWRAGAHGLDAAARAFGRRLLDCLLEGDSELREAWREARAQASAAGVGLRLEIRCPDDAAAHWQGQSLSAIPFELLCDDGGFLFRRPGWSTVRRAQKLKSRTLRSDAEAAAGRLPRVQVAWANVRRSAEPDLPETLFVAHDLAVAELAKADRAEHLPPLPAATRDTLADALEARRPHVLVWIGHGEASGSALRLHDADNARYPGDEGRPVKATDFAAAVREGGVDIALLWSCHGAGTFRGHDVGVAEALLNPEIGDVAAVLASFSTLDAAVVAPFSRTLIEAWSQGDGDLEAALARARGRLDEASLDWARPVLFLRTMLDGPGPRLPRPASPAPAPAPAQGPRRLRWLPQLPATATRYIDHHRRVDRLRRELAEHAVVVVEGLAGAGKTELALALAHALRAGGEDVAFVDLSAQRSHDRLRQTLGFLVQEAPFEDDTQLLAALAGLRWTLVLDNVEDVLPNEALRVEMLGLLAALCDGSTAFRAVLTSRHALERAGAPSPVALFTHEARLLDPAEARELFVAAAGPRLAPAQASAAVLDPFLAELGGIARAVVLMAGLLGGAVDVSALRQRLAAIGAEAIADDAASGEDVPPSLDRHLSKSRLASALRLSLASAIRQAPGVADLFDVLGTLPGGLLQTLLPRADDEQLGDALGALLDHHLVQLDGEERRIMMAAPVRAWAWRRWMQRAGTSGPDVALIDAVHGALTAHAAGLAADFATERGIESRLRFLADAGNVTQAIEVRVDATWTPADDAAASMMFSSLVRMAEVAGTASASLPVLQGLQEKILARAPVSALAAGACLGVGSLKAFNDELDDAGRLLADALRISRDVGDRQLEANALQHLGQYRARCDDVPGARSALEEALAVLRAIDDRLGQANVLAALADLDVRGGDGATGRARLDEALTLYESLPSLHGMASVHHLRAELRLREPDLAGSGADIDRALALFRQTNNRLGEANALKTSGRLHEQLRDPLAATRCYDAALAIYRDVGDRLGQAYTLKAQALLLARAGDAEAARGKYEEALALFDRIRDRMGHAQTLGALGAMDIAAGDLARARGRIEASLRIAREIGDVPGEALVLSSLGDLRLRENDLEGALQCYDAARAIDLRVGDRIGVCDALRSLAKVKMLQGAAQAGFDLLCEALALCEVIGDRTGAAELQMILAGCADLVGATSTAIAWRFRGLRSFAALGDRPGTVAALVELAEALRDHDAARAIACLHEALKLADDLADAERIAAQAMLDELVAAQAATPAGLAHVDRVRAESAAIVASLGGQFETGLRTGEITLYPFATTPSSPEST